MDGLGRAPVVTLPPLHQGPDSTLITLATPLSSRLPPGITSYASGLLLLPKSNPRRLVSLFIHLRHPSRASAYYRQPAPGPVGAANYLP